MANDILSIVELTSEKVICSVNVTDPLQVAQNPAYSMNDAYITVWRERDKGAGWRGLLVNFVDKSGNSTTVRTRNCGYGTHFELVMSIIHDIEQMLNEKGLSLYNNSMHPYVKAQVSAVWGGRWWGTLIDEFGHELNVGCIGKQDEMSWIVALTTMLDLFNLPFYGPSYVTCHRAYNGPRPTTNCTYYFYDIESAAMQHSAEED